MWNVTSWQTITFELTHENKSCSAYPKDQHKHLIYDMWQLNNTVKKCETLWKSQTDIFSSQLLSKTFDILIFLNSLWRCTKEYLRKNCVICKAKKCIKKFRTFLVCRSHSTVMSETPYSYKVMFFLKHCQAQQCDRNVPVSYTHLTLPTKA